MLHTLPHTAAWLLSAASGGGLVGTSLTRLSDTCHGRSASCEQLRHTFLQPPLTLVGLAACEPAHAIAQRAVRVI